MTQQLLIIRGLPGSGKSTFAKSLWPQFHHVEADMFFVDGDGKYNFDAKKHKEAHDWCYSTAERLLANGESVAVSNTFTRIWEFSRYLLLPVRKQVITCEGGYSNVHGVPITVLEDMKKRWEPYPARLSWEPTP